MSDPTNRQSLKVAVEARVLGTLEATLDVKRFYMPGVVLKAKCPHCGAEAEKDFETEYLSYPQAGGLQFEHMYHEGPDGTAHEFVVPIVLKVTLEVR